MKRYLIIISFIFNLILLSCSVTSSHDVQLDAIPIDPLPTITTEPLFEIPPVPTEPIEYTDQVPSNGADAFERSLTKGLFQTTWPEVLPADIPVLEGKISNVMGTDPSYIRIFYEPIPVKDIEDYVQLCKKQGFDITLVAYDVIGFPEDAEERLREGEYDAIEFHKGYYSMHLEHGKDVATLDIMVEMNN